MILERSEEVREEKDKVIKIFSHWSATGKKEDYLSLKKYLSDINDYIVGYGNTKPTINPLVEFYTSINQKENTEMNNTAAKTTSTQYSVKAQLADTLIELEAELNREDSSGTRLEFFYNKINILEKFL